MVADFRGRHRRGFFSADLGQSLVVPGGRLRAVVVGSLERAQLAARHRSIHFHAHSSRNFVFLDRVFDLSENAARMATFDRDLVRERVGSG